MVSVYEVSISFVYERMSLDVGSVAKGFATEIIAQEMIKEGFTSGVISPGGNSREHGGH